MEIDLTVEDDFTPFLPETWIGKEKIFPRIVPPFIQRAYDKAFKIPIEQLALLPEEDRLVAHFLMVPLPGQSNLLVNYSVESCFSTEAPNENLELLRTRPLPSKALMKELIEFLGQAWFNASKSVVDRRYKMSRFPLWTVQFWDCMQRVVKGQAAWRLCENWIGEQRNVLGMQPNSAFALMLDRAEFLMENIQWNAPLNILGAYGQQTTTLKLMKLLTNECLTDDLIDMAIQNLSKRLRESRLTTANGVSMLTTLAFSRVISTVQDKNTSATNLPYLLRVYRDALRSKNAPSILTGPVFVELSQNAGDVSHWVAYKVNLRSREISYCK